METFRYTVKVNDDLDHLGVSILAAEIELDNDVESTIANHDDYTIIVVAYTNIESKLRKLPGVEDVTIDE